MAEILKKKVGMYAWGGPGTIRLLKKKYHHPRIDQSSFLDLYDLKYLRQAKSLFGITDAWVTYSWGFSDATEQQDYDFIVGKLKNFQDLKIATHAYIQGLNVVTLEFIDQDIFCTDPDGNKLPYSKGRSFTCPNNSAAVKIILDRVKKACQENFSGIFIDNILFGLPPATVYQNFVPFFGCACHYCQAGFQVEFGYPLPLKGFTASELKDFLHFRVRSTEKLIRAAAELAKKYHKQFGINLYDPFIHTPALYFGYSLEKLLPYLSYLLIENHAHPARIEIGNSHLTDLIKQTQKPIFVVSYKRGIGFEKQFTQADVDVLFSESRTLGYSVCLKITEYTTRGIWHALNLNILKKPKLINLKKSHQKSVRKVMKRGNVAQVKFARFKQKYLPKTLRFVYEHRQIDFVTRKLGLYQKQLWSVKDYDLK